MSGLWKSDVAFLAVVLGIGIVGAGAIFGEPSDVEVTAAHVAEADERKAQMPPAERQALMAHPLGECPWIEHCSPRRGCKRRFTCAADLSLR